MVSALKWMLKGEKLYREPEEMSVHGMFRKY